MSSYSDDLQKLFSDSGLVLVSRVVSMGIGFLAHTLLVRNLDPDTFGVLSLAVTIVSVSAGLAVLGMGQTVTRFISASPEDDASKYVTVGLFTALIIGSVVTVLLFSGGNFLEVFFGTKNLSSIIQVLALLVVLRPLAKVILGVVRGFEKTRWKVVSNDITPIILSFVVFIVFILYDRILTGAILFYLLRPVFKILLLGVNLSRWNDWHYSFSIPSRPLLSDMLSFAWPVALQGLVVTFMGNMDVLMLGWLSSSAEVGYYRSIQPVAKMLIFFLSSLTFIYLPIATRYYSNEEFDELDSIYKTATRWVTQATFPLFLFYILFGRDFIRVVFTKEYAVAWIALGILSVGMYSRVFVGPNGMTIKAIDRTREDLLASISSLITNAILNVLLIPQYGIEGAAMATTLSFFVYNALEVSLIYRYTGVNPFHWDLVTPMLPTAFVTIALTVLIGFQTPSFPVLFLIGIGICCIHVVSIALVTGLRPEDRLLLEQLRSE